MSVSKLSDRRPVLLTVSGTIPESLDDRVAAGRRPRADYRVLQERFDADLVDAGVALARTGRTGRFIHRFLGVGALLGWFCFRSRRDYDVIVTDGEQVGIPLAVLSRVFGRGRARHMMIVHILSVPKKARLVRWTRSASLIDRYLVYCTWQAEFIHHALRVPRQHIVLSTFMVDTAFFDPEIVDVPRMKMICSAGLERRDYPTLMTAVAGLDVEVVIAAASPWSKQADSTQQADIPPNVEIRRLDLSELRDLYAASRFVVMPLEQVDFQAGITTILEAMSMGRLVLCTTTPGQTDTIVDGQTGRYVAPDDPDALRTAIEDLLHDIDSTDAIGSAARAWTVADADIDVYAQRLADVVTELRQR